MFDVRVEWFLSYSLTSSIDAQFDAAKIRMTDLFMAIHNSFQKPAYWVDKEQSYYSLFANFLKVCLIAKMPQNTFTFFVAC